MLGKALIEQAREYELCATYVGNYEISGDERLQYRKLDILDVEGYRGLFMDWRPEVVVHAASIGSPDFAEKNRELTWKVNVEGTQGLIGLCEEFGAHFIYISSNGIYDGEHAPYKAEAEARPVNFYGETKLAGEKATLKAQVRHAIIRPILMYGWPHPFERGNIVTIALAKLKKGETVYAYDEVFSNPLLAENCAAALMKVIQDSRYEAFNLAGRDIVSIYQLLRETAEVFGYDPGLVKPVKQGYFNEMVKRPANTSYDITKMERSMGVTPLSLREGLRRMKETAA